METSTDYTHPYRPKLIRLVNSVGEFGRRMGVEDQLNAGKLVASAKHKTGLSDLGEEWFMDGLRKLIESINSEARLTTTGRLIQRVKLSKTLVNRLYVEEFVKRHPEVMEVDLGKLVFIVGMQRTGTTTLHRLINAHPDMQGLTAWEALNPIPLPKERARNPRKRMKEARRSEKAIRYLSPDFMAVHPIQHDEPEEDVLLLDLCFMSQSAEATMHVPSYASWLEQQDHIPVYQYFHKVLRILHWLHPSKGWVLKTPHHMEYLTSLLKVFPRASLVETYRDPQKTLPSFCSMVAHARGMLSDDVDPYEIGRHWCRKVKRMMDHVMNTRAVFGDNNFVTVSYYDLISDPIKQLKRIYEHVGITFDETAESRANSVVAASPQNRFGQHKYQSDSFGLTTEAINQQLKLYRAFHSIPYE